MSICSYQTSSPTRDKFAGPSFTDQLPSCALLSFCSPVVYPRAGGPSVPLFFPLNSADTWPSSLPSDFLRGVSGSRVAIGRYFTRAEPAFYGAQGMFLSSFSTIEYPRSEKDSYNTSYGNIGNKRILNNLVTSCTVFETDSFPVTLLVTFRW